MSLLVDNCGGSFINFSNLTVLLSLSLTKSHFIIYSDHYYSLNGCLSSTQHQGLYWSGLQNPTRGSDLSIIPAFCFPGPTAYFSCLSHSGLSISVPTPFFLILSPQMRCNVKSSIGGLALPTAIATSPLTPTWEASRFPPM